MKYTEDQLKIIEYLRNQLGPEGHNVIVSGAGGVGKTAMICQFISELLREEYHIAVTAMTGKATAVLRSKIHANLAEQKMSIPKNEILLIETVTKVTKESKVLGLTDSGETLYTNTWRDPVNFGKNYDILFVDELSMIPHFISQWWQMAGIRVFGFGDHCQLPEVVTNETKRELTSFKHDLKLPTTHYVSGYGVKVLKDMAHMSLYKVLRSDNEIALLCGELRDFSNLTKSQIVQNIKKWAAKTDNVQYSTSMNDLEQTNDWQIIAYTNKMCQKINNSLCIGEDYPDMQDKIILFDNLNPLKLYNGDVLFFAQFTTMITEYNLRHQKYKIYVCLKWQNKMPRKDSPHPAERQFFENYVQFKRESERVNRDRLSALPSIIRRSGFAEAQIEEYVADVMVMIDEEPNVSKCFNQIIERFYEIDRDMAKFIMDNSESLPRLYMVSADFGYAITTHKSQGSEYQNVCYLLERFDKPLLYTGISRAKEKVKVINLTNEK